MLIYNCQKERNKIKKKGEKRYEHLHNYFNGSSTKTGSCVVSEDRAIEVLGLNNYDV